MVVKVARSKDVSDDFWRRVRAEWGQAGPFPNSVIYVPLETFTQRQSWLPTTARRFEVQIVVDDPAIRSILLRLREDRTQLQRILQEGKLESAADLDELPESKRFVRELRQFQRRDLAKLVSLPHGANFSVPGAGKTTVQLAVYETERSSEHVEQMLVVAPISAFEAWLEESKECLEPAPIVNRHDGNQIPSSTEILLVNYQRLTVSYDELARWVESRPTLVVLDEAHRIKRGRDGEWGRRALDLAYLAHRRDVLTGTPAPQHPSDLIALMNFLWPAQAQRILPSEAVVPQPAPEAIANVASAIMPLFVRTTKPELELPEPNKRVVRVPLKGLHREIYDSLRRRFSTLVRTQRDRVDLGTWGQVAMYMLEAATNPALLPAGSSTSDPIEFRHPPLDIPADADLSDLIANYASYETPEKFVQLAALVDQMCNEGRKVLIWSNFIRNLETVERMLARHEPALVHGGIPSATVTPNAPRRREEEIRRFREDPRCGVLLANPAAMSEGISLHQTCHDAIYLDRTFNAGQFLQSVDRIHRLGLDPSIETTITFLVTEDSIDESVLLRIDQKTRNLARMLDDPSIVTMALPDDDDSGTPIDVGDDADLEALFRHLRGD